MVEIASRGEATYLSLRQDILSCTLAPGSTLTEPFLMERYDVGKSTCRVALARMVQEGFVRSVPRQGYVVTPVTMKDVEELFQMRLFLEPAAARLAAGRTNTDALADMEKLTRSNKVSRNSGNRMSTFLDSNQQFHLAIARASGNSRLVQSIENLLDEMKRLVALGFLQQGASPEIADDHEELIKALQTGNGDAAEEIAARHVRTFRDMTLERIIDSIRANNEGLPLTASIGAGEAGSRKTSRRGSGD